MSASSPSSSVLLTVEDKAPPVTRSAQQYTAIAPRGMADTAASAITEADENAAAHGLTAIAPATESRSEGMPINSANSGERSGKRKKTSDGAPPGSEAWHKLRRESHKEVERRRREVINKGIDSLAELIPGAERNKGKIIAQAVDYIHRLKTTEAANIEKWTIEKLLADQAISELTSQVEQLKGENKMLRRKLKAAQIPIGSGEDEDAADDDEDVEAEEEQQGNGIGSLDIDAIHEAAHAAASTIALAHESAQAKGEDN